MWGLGIAAWVILLQALATYLAVFSAFLLARPVVKNQTLDAHREFLRDVENAPSDVAALFREARNHLDHVAGARQRYTFAQNRWGYLLILGSLIAFSIAFGLQIRSDPAFVRALGASG